MMASRIVRKSSGKNRQRLQYTRPNVLRIPRTWRRELYQFYVLFVTVDFVVVCCALHETCKLCLTIVYISKYLIKAKISTKNLRTRNSVDVPLSTSDNRYMFVHFQGVIPSYALHIDWSLNAQPTELTWGKLPCVWSACFAKADSIRRKHYSALQIANTLGRNVSIVLQIIVYESLSIGGLNLTPPYLLHEHK
jgi:hypothetical protein